MSLLAPAEAILLEDPNVFACLMFGRGRFQNGLLIQPEESFDPRDEAALEAYRNKIWYVLCTCTATTAPSTDLLVLLQALYREDERVCTLALAHLQGGTSCVDIMQITIQETHARVCLPPQMIMVTKPEKPLEYTAKGTPRRQVCIASYSEEIDALYKKVEESSQLDIAPPRDWSPESVHEYVREVVQNVMKNPNIGDTDDLFQQGCDRCVSSRYLASGTIPANRRSTRAVCRRPGSATQRRTHSARPRPSTCTRSPPPSSTRTRPSTRSLRTSRV